MFVPIVLPTDDDVESLARLVGDEACERSVREAALVRLQEVHCRIARRFGIRCQQSRGDLVQHANQKVWNGHYEVGSASYRAWCSRVMQNWLIDNWRHDDRRKQVDAAWARSRLAESRDESIRDWVEQEDWRSPFSASDFDRVCDWPSDSMRVLLLARGLLWVKVASEQWVAWTRNVGIAESFPTDGYEHQLETVRHRQLAEALKMRVNTLHVAWGRWREHLEALEYVQGLRNLGRE